MVKKLLLLATLILFGFQMTAQNTEVNIGS